MRRPATGSPQHAGRGQGGKAVDDMPDIKKLSPREVLKLAFRLAGGMLRREEPGAGLNAHLADVYRQEVAKDAVARDRIRAARRLP